MEIPKNALNWFEIPVLNFERAKKFYSTLLACEMPENQMGPKRMGFFPSGQFLVGGAIVQGPGFTPSKAGTLAYLNCFDDLQPALDRVVKAGGTVEQTKTLITPQIGYYAIFTDTEGNRVALHSMR